ncbi:MAG: glycoside hydrolase family 3 C-terminal domain-containing protein [Bacteroidetes bacterium]|nr:glycoside hydrolase family 3 C-terminal domain-containing protein [Bacteroidota bacterium]
MFKECFSHLILLILVNMITMNAQDFVPRSYTEALQLADSIIALMTEEELLSYIGGDRSFFIRPIPRLGIREVYMTDATQGVHIREKFHDADLSKYALRKSTAFPCPLALTATWNTELAYKYARAIGEECRAGGIGILLGPGLNHYRHAQCGRNFEYFGEDPFLRSQLIAAYVQGVQSTGTVATLKHFVANNTEYYRRKSNSIIDERTLHEIYLPGFKAGIDAGATAVMTSYNLLNGEWCGQSEYVINVLLRKELGFKYLVMTDWWSVYDGTKVIKSGQDLEMPCALAVKNARELVVDGKVSMDDIRRMVRNILTTYFRMRLDKRKPDPQYYETFPYHEHLALEVARESIVLLKNENKILPIKNTVTTILVTGEYIEKLAMGGGSAEVKGYNTITLLDALKQEFHDRIVYKKAPTDEDIRTADVVLCNVGTFDSEGWDRPFELPAPQEDLVNRCVTLNPRTIVVVTSGGGVRMTAWAPRAKAILYAWYGGQNGSIAIAEVLSGKVTPSGKLPITIEREFCDSPGYGYIPIGEKLYTGWHGEEEKEHPVYNIEYKEGIFTGYRWYDAKNIEPLYPFGFGLSYTTFEYSDIKVSQEKIKQGETLIVSCKLKNIGMVNGKEIVQVYIRDVQSSVPRPPKELKGFVKVALNAGEQVRIEIPLKTESFAFWSPQERKWVVEPGEFELLIGTSSRDIRLKKTIVVED